MTKITDKDAKRKSIKGLGSTIGWFIIVSGILAFPAFVFSGRKYNVTFIRFSYVALASLVAGLIIGAIILQFFHRLTGERFDSWQHYTAASLIYGLILSSIFFWTNSHLAKSSSYMVKVPILARYQTYRSKTMYVKLTVDGLEKDVPMPYSTLSDVMNADYVILSLKKGYWGFTVIMDRQLSKN